MLVNLDLCCVSGLVLLISCFVFLGSIHEGKTLWNIKFLDKGRNNNMGFSYTGWNHGFQGDLKFACCSQNLELATVADYITCPSYTVYCFPKHSCISVHDLKCCGKAAFALQPLITKYQHHLAQYHLEVGTNPTNSVRCQNKLDLKMQAFCDSSNVGAWTQTSSVVDWRSLWVC